ncbi:uncharacterized protein N7459_001885 [Penicillium hispanicum]|uniref:uncharacterized protein n=1 Tax=Penicillium hispanicum TaxID=1080232 RepID=UPI002541DA02|nr:uncharacterized protein N7459_001885 [Penicillium hispanicum]KAJ5591516.1 hypothetical protein N7459_001885 [Penicillium hispanicum]
MAPRRPDDNASKKRNLSTYGAMVAQARAPKVAKGTETDSKSSLPLNGTTSASEACPPTPIAAAKTVTSASSTPGYAADATSKVTQPQPESADGEQTMSLPTAMLSDRYLNSTDQADNEEAEEEEEVVIPADTLSR